MSPLSQQLEQLGVHVDAQLFDVALTHRSYAYENGRLESNERLEFLGDAVLQIIVTEHLFRTYPELAEGQLAKLRASVVSSDALAGVARDLGLGPSIKLGRGELATGGHDKTSILADTTEAVIGAAFISGGQPAAARLVHALLDERLAAAVELGEYTDSKTQLQELCAAHGWSVPSYQVVGSGPDHQREFTAHVIVDGAVVGTGVAPSKKRAEQRAARVACHDLAASAGDA